MPGSKSINTAVVGLGARGLYFTSLYSRKEHPVFNLRAVCDKNKTRLAEVRAALDRDVAGYTDIREMLADRKIEAVIVATNDPDHAGPAVAALRAGKHVFIEKPLCQNLADAQAIARAARRTKKVFMVGFELRHCNLFREVKRLLDEGRIGDVKIGHAFDNVSVGGNYFFHDPAKQTSFFKSLLLQKACHSLDLLNWFMGSDPAKVYGIGGLDFYGGREDPKLRCGHCRRAKKCPYRVEAERFRMDYGVTIRIADYCVWSRDMNLKDNSELCISYTNGGKATFHECHFTPEYSREFWLVGTRGKLYGYYDNPGRFLIRIEYAHSPERRTEEFRPPHLGGGHGGGDEGLREEFRRRIAGWKTGRTRALNLEDIRSGYYSTALAACAEESIDTGRPVIIPALK